MIFYSEVPEAVKIPDMADPGAPPAKAGDNILACGGVSPFCPGETGAEGNNGVDYRPGGASVAFPTNNEYVGASDVPVSAPESASVVLLGSGLVAFGTA